VALRPLLTEYVSRLSAIAGNLINCAPVLNWLEVDNRGRRLFPPPPSDDADAEINTPAVAAAYAIRRYAAIASDEISFEVCPYIWPSPVIHSVSRRLKLEGTGSFP
jgi:Rho GTPase-activating protein 32